MIDLITAIRSTNTLTAATILHSFPINSIKILNTSCVLKQDFFTSPVAGCCKAVHPYCGGHKRLTDWSQGPVYCHNVVVAWRRIPATMNKMVNAQDELGNNGRRPIGPISFFIVVKDFGSVPWACWNFPLLESVVVMTRYTNDDKIDNNFHLMS